MALFPDDVATFSLRRRSASPAGMKARVVAAQRRLRRRIAAALPGCPELRRPVFIVGCGRSGTTILGQVLARHGDLAYLNEPRDIWGIDPRTDIWSPWAEGRGGRLRLAREDVRPDAALRIARAFAAEVRLQGAERLVEKLPINAFRIGFIDATFPDARFVHVVRHGLEVAVSIADRAAQGGWFGHGDYKWRLLEADARARGEGAVVELCTDGFSRGLLEWRLSVAAALESLRALPPDRQIEVRYEELLAAPAQVCERLEGFIGVPPHAAMRQFALATIGRRSAPAARAPMPQTAHAIAGDLMARLGYLDAPAPAALHA